MSLEQAIIANTEAIKALLAAIQALPESLAKQISNTPVSATGKTVKDEAPKPDPLAEFVASLSGINWKWEDAEDPATFKAGKVAYNAAKEVATKLGKKALAAFDAAEKAGKAGEPAASATTAETATTANAETPSIALPDLLKLGNAIQAFKKVDPDKGPKAVEAFKAVVVKTGATRLSDPALKPEKFPEVHAALSAICAENDIFAALDKAGVKLV
jgi:hypothetical protein